MKEQETYEVNNMNRENQKLDSETGKILIANMLKFFLFLILVELIITLHMMVFEMPRETEKTVVVDDSTPNAR